MVCTGTGHPVPELGVEYQYPTWGTGTPLSRKLIWCCVSVPNKGYRYTKLLEAFFGARLGLFERGFMVLSH